MRESFVLIILPLLVISVRCSNVDGDSYNLFKGLLSLGAVKNQTSKPTQSDTAVYAANFRHSQGNQNLHDRMRARSRVAPKIDPQVTNLWDSYAPLQGFEYLNMPIWLPEYRKRAANIVKKRMMDDLVQFDERLNKRTSKAALSLMLQSKQDPEHMEENRCFAGK